MLRIVESRIEYLSKLSLIKRHFQPNREIVRLKIIFFRFYRYLTLRAVNVFSDIFSL
jgi:hypothetical protein